MKLRPLDLDPRGWLASEKLDGVQGVWTGTRLLTRNGHRLAAPAWFTAALPACRLTGELWMGRGTFPELVGTIQRKGSDWRGVRFHLFDAHLPGAFEERLQAMHKLIMPSHCSVIPHRIIGDPGEVDRYEREVVAGGGEGLVLRLPSAPYRPGRSGDVLKVKRLFPDLNRAID